MKGEKGVGPLGKNRWTQLSETQFDKTTKRYEYWEVLSLSLSTLTRNFRIYLYIVSLVIILSNWVPDNWVYQFQALGPVELKRKLGSGDQWLINLNCLQRGRSNLVDLAE